MQAQDYVDWCRYAGLYLGNESHFARYRAFGEKISPAGLATVIVSDFLKDNAPVLNVQEWRNYRVYEMDDQAQSRIEQTAAALAAIGAGRTAAKVRAVKSTSPLDMLSNLEFDELRSAVQDVKLVDLMKDFREHVGHAFPEFAEDKSGKPTPVDADVESREQIEHLLERYVTLHEGELQADIDKHGDPRQTPGFTPEGRMQELERQERLRQSQETQRGDLQKLEAVMDKIEKRLAKGTPPARLASLRREFLEHYRRNRDLPKDELTPEMRDLLPRAGRFMEMHADLFRPNPTGDPELLQRLAALGEYEVDKGKKEVNIRWDSPKGFDCSWTTFALSMTFPKKDPQSLRAMLNEVERLAKRFSGVSEEWREQLIDSFRERAGMMADWELEGYDLDDAGEATDESILRHVGGGALHMMCDPESDGLYTQAHFAIEWDEEHGLEVAWEDETAEVSVPSPQGEEVAIESEKSPAWLKPLLEGEEVNPAPPRESKSDTPGMAALWQAAQKLPKGQDILVSIQIKSPPVTRVEKAYYHECHYRLSILVKDDKVTFNDMNTPRQDYLFAGPWPALLFAPILQWAELTPLWPTLEVREFDWAKAVKKRNYEGPLRDDLLEDARRALEQAFNAEEAAARGVKLRK